MKVLYAARAALGLLILCLPLTASAATGDTAVATPPVSVQTTAVVAGQPVKAVLAWHRVGSPGLPRETVVG